MSFLHERITLTSFKKNFLIIHVIMILRLTNLCYYMKIEDQIQTFELAVKILSTDLQKDYM